jgi:hypothetical protein
MRIRNPEMNNYEISTLESYQTSVKKLKLSQLNIVI